MSGIMELYRRWPEDLVEGFREASGLGLEVGGDIVFCGMGGSASAGDYLAVLSRITGGPRISVVKDFSAWEGPGEEGYTLIACSYSGNTVETLWCASRYGDRASGVVTLSSGGRLLELSRERGWAHIKLPRGYHPRAAFSRMIGALLGLVWGSVLGLGDVKAVSNYMGESSWARAGELLRVLDGRSIAAIDVCEPTIPLGVRLKNELSENSKMMAKISVYPESAHNDIVPLEAYKDQLAAAIIAGGWGFCKEVLTVVGDIYREIGVPYASFNLDLNSPLGFLREALSLTMAFGIASVRLARARGFEPEPTPLIDRYKALLKGLLQASPD